MLSKIKLYQVSSSIRQRMSISGQPMSLTFSNETAILFGCRWGFVWVGLEIVRVKFGFCLDRVSSFHFETLLY